MDLAGEPSTGSVVEGTVGLAKNKTLHVVIVGAGLGGLACAIACRRANPPCDVTVLERVPEMIAIGTGIHIPPNACRVMHHFGLVEQLKNAGGYAVQDFTLRRYKDGEIIVEKPLGERVEREYGAEWIAIHRGDYQGVLLEAARSSGARILTDSDVIQVETGVDELEGRQIAVLKDGRRIDADVVVGADGLWSGMREFVLGRPMPPVETGDLAYRGTFTRDQLKSFGNARIDALIEKSNVQVWLGPGRHAVFYPLRNKTEFNLVLLVADDLPSGVRTSEGSLEQMTKCFEGWDPILTLIISCLKTALKWKLLHFKALDKWTRVNNLPGNIGLHADMEITKGPVALLGDASHPTLPYQGQGAAMAVEDGAILGVLLTRLQETSLSTVPKVRNAQLTSLLQLYERLRKQRTEVNVSGAVLTREFYHLHDGELQQARDRELSDLPRLRWQGPSKWNWGDADYQKSLLGFDVLADAENSFDEWSRTGQATVIRSTL